jgi:RNA polymerase sigma-70 factor (ECF subfamily)
MADRKEDDRTESWLVLRAQAGDLDSLDDLFRRIQEPLFRYIEGMVRDADLSRDILQEALLRIYRKVKWLRDPALFRAWSYRIASREVFRHTRARQRYENQMDNDVVLDELPAADPAVADAALIGRIPGLIDDVSPASRAVIVLFYLQEFSLLQVADILGLPLGTVKSRLAYGLQVLRQRVSALDDASAGGRH